MKPLGRDRRSMSSPGASWKSGSWRTAGSEAAASAARATGAFITLDEGLKAGRVQVAEVGGGSVNQLNVTNEDDKPLYLMGGEVVLGGQQDRLLGSDTIIPAKSKSVPVTVFCV